MTTVRAQAPVPPNPTEDLAGSSCDRCSASALVMVESQIGDRLGFCGHHYRRNEDALVLSGWKVVVDRRPLLAEV